MKETKLTYTQNILGASYIDKYVILSWNLAETLYYKKYILDNIIMCHNKSIKPIYYDIEIIYY